MKMLIQQFRANDLNPSEGKQIEFGKNAFEEITSGKKIEGNVKFIYKSEDSLNGSTINVICTYIPDRTNYKLYQNNEESLKKFFIGKLNLSEDSVGKDFFTVSFVKNTFEFSYFPATSEIGKFFESNKLSGNVININDNNDTILNIPYPHNRIIFGAPGTGKSHLLEKESKEFNHTQNLTDQFKTELKELCGPNHSMADYAAFGLKYYNNILNTFMKGESFSKADFVPIYADCIPKEILDSGTLLDNIARVCNGCNKLGISTFITKEYQSNIERVTFHPNYSYAQFVGTYKPVSINENGKREISYEYVPGPFINTWIRAYKSGQPQLLLIEEINRANVAAVFGDIFQLLDRDSNGNSEYPINICNDLKKYLVEKEEINIETMIIPSNMYIWATMNSADQGVLPMDAAFKRRWDFEYLGIDDAEKNDDGSENTEFKSYVLPIPHKDSDGNISYTSENWNKIRHAINDKLKNIYGVNEDKLLGPYFLSKSTLDEAKQINCETETDKAEKICSLFKSKVLMYLYEDVVKMNPTELFNKSVFSEDKPLHYSDLCNKFDELGLKIFDEDFIK